MIDAHQHYWRVDRGDYFWMHDNPAVAEITRDFLPSDLQAAREAVGITQTILVQAAPTTEETEFLLALGESEPSVAGIVGWIDFEQPSQRELLERWSENPLFCGVRPMIQDLPDPEWMHREDIQWAFEAIVELDLTFDALGFVQHLDPFERLFNRYPNMRTVIDHGMKPLIRERKFDDWAEAMERIAETTGVYCKCSGLLTEAQPGDGVQELQPYVEHLRSIFPHNRLMWGSDWPVLTLNGDYQSWFAMTESVLGSAQDNPWLFADSAAEFYRIPST